MKGSWLEILWKAEIIRSGLVDAARKIKKTRLRLYGDEIRRDEGQPVTDIME